MGQAMSDEEFDIGHVFKVAGLFAVVVLVSGLVGLISNLG